MAACGGGENKTQSNYDGGHRRAGFRFFWVIGALLVVAVAALIITAATRVYYPLSTVTPYYGYPFFGWFFFPFGFFFIFFLIFFVSRLIFWPWGWGWGGRRRYWYGYGDAHEILRQRYAKGEITKDQFDQMNRDLEQHQ